MAHGAHDHKKTYLRVWMTLLALTVITVEVAYHDFGTWNIVIAMLVATVKAVLVILFFMHLKYDNKVNQVVFIAAFVFLAIFVGLTASDSFFRPVERASAVEKGGAAAGGDAGDVEKLRVATPELVEKGKTVYGQQCATCHGASGAGDGPAAVALNPRPRNFTSEEGWKQGRAPSQIFKTLTDGLPGTPMPSFSAMPPPDRWALVHYVRSLSPNPPDDTPESIAALTGGAPVEPQRPRLPISIAMQLMTEPEARLTQHTARSTQHENSLGGQLYSQHCAGCHGAGGEGGIPVQTIGVNPYVHVKTKGLIASTGDWKQNEARFVQIVSQGLPGVAKPGLTHFTPTEWHALYEYVKALAQ